MMKKTKITSRQSTTVIMRTRPLAAQKSPARRCAHTASKRTEEGAQSASVRGVHPSNLAIKSALWDWFTIAGVVRLVSAALRPQLRLRECCALVRLIRRIITEKSGRRMTALVASAIRKDPAALKWIVHFHVSIQSSFRLVFNQFY